MLLALPFAPLALAVNQTIATSVTEPSNRTVATGDTINVEKGGVWTLWSPHYSSLFFDGGTINVNGGVVTNLGSVNRDVRIGQYANNTPTLNILNGGSVTVGAWFTVGEVGNASILVDGPGSVLNGRPLLGYNGSGTLTLANGGALNGDILLGNREAGTATLNIGAARNSAAVRAGIVNGAVRFGPGSNLLVFNHTDNDYVFKAPIVGASGSLEFVAGTTTLAGDNTFVGATTLTGGTLKIDSDGRLGDADNTLNFNGGTLATTADISSQRALTVTANGAVIDTAAGTQASFSNGVSGTGALSKQGQGSLQLTGMSSLSGATTVRAGTLLVNGSLANSAVTVMAGAALAGNGSIGTLNARSGSVVGGSSAGPLTVTGNYSASTGSTLLADPRAGAVLKVNGSATIDPGATLAVSNGYTLNSRYTALTANQGVTGHFAFSPQVSAFYALGVSYDPDAVYYSVTQNRAFTAVARTPNQRATAQALQRLPASSALADAVGRSQTDDDGRVALGLLSGEVHASLQSATVEDSRFVRDAVNERLRCTDASLSCQAPVDGNGLWAQSFGAWGQADSTANTARFTRNTRGLLFGTDTALASWRVGAMLGLGQSNFDAQQWRSTAKSANYHVGLYAGREWGPLALRTGLAYTRQAVDTTRSVAIPLLNERLNAHYNVNTTQAFAELGYRLQREGITLEPFLNLAQVIQQGDSSREKGGNAALALPGQSRDVTFVTPGVRLSTAFTLAGKAATAHGSLGWRQALGDTQTPARMSFAGSDSFAVKGAAVANNTAQLKTGVGIALTREVSLNLGYEGLFGQRHADQSATLSVSAAF